MDPVWEGSDRLYDPLLTEPEMLRIMNVALRSELQKTCKSNWPSTISRVGVRDGVNVMVGVKEGVLVGRGVLVLVGVGDGPGVIVDVGDLVGVGVRVGLGVLVPVAVGDGPGVMVEVGVRVAVGVRVFVGVGEGPGVFVGVGVLVIVGVRVGVGVLVGVLEGRGRQVPTAERFTCSNSEVEYVTAIDALPAVLKDMLWFEPRSNKVVTGDFPGSLIV